ncbi:MAG: hypothetical protein ABIJ10_05780 [Candidatus Micrarchaeota archaeon]
MNYLRRREHFCQKLGDQRALQTLLGKYHAISSSDSGLWTVIGSGAIGSKADQLKIKTEIAEQAGFLANPRIVLTTAFFDNFREHKKFDKAELKIIRQIAKLFAGTPLAVRSSAIGDARGTGIWKSGFCPNQKRHGDPIDLEDIIIEVIYSDFSKDADAFRKNNDIQGGMAIIIEPIVGNRANRKEGKELYGPYYGGIGYTSTAYNNGFILFTSGMPNYATRGLGFEIVNGSDVSLIDKCTNYRKFNMENARASWGISNDRIDWSRGIWIRLESGSLFIGHTDQTHKLRTTVEGNELTAEWIFQRMKKLEELTGGPQYIEWAICDGPGIVIIQIADTDIKNDVYEFTDSEKVMIRSNFVSGSGIVECDGIVFLENLGGTDALEEYNETNQKYLLIYDGDLNIEDYVRYCHISNAAAVVEIYTTVHTKHPKAHFGTALTESGAIFMVSNDASLNMLKKPEEFSGNTTGTIKIWNQRVRVTASEAKQRAIAERLE